MKSRSFLERTPFVQRGAQSLIDFFFVSCSKGLWDQGVSQLLVLHDVGCLGDR